MGNLKSHREKISMSQGVLANISGISMETIKRYETVKESINQAPADKLYKLANALECNMEDLLEGLE